MKLWLIIGLLKLLGAGKVLAGDRGYRADLGSAEIHEDVKLVNLPAPLSGDDGDYSATDITYPWQNDEKVYELNTSSLKSLKAKCPNIRNETDQHSKNFRVDRDTGLCLYVGSECGNRMSFYIEEVGSIYGFCDCYISDLRANVYDVKSNSCAPIYSQGGCSITQHLIINQQGRPECGENPCYLNGTNFVQLDEECYELYKPSPACGEYEIVGLTDNGYKPACEPNKSGFTFSVSQKVSSCHPGSRFSVLRRKCVPTVHSSGLGR